MNQNLSRSEASTLLCRGREGLVEPMLVRNSITSPSVRTLCPFIKTAYAAAENASAGIEYSR